MRIINLLETIEVDEEHCHRAFPASAPGEGGLHAIVEQAAVRQARQLVVPGRMQELLLLGVIGRSGMACQHNRTDGLFFNEERHRQPSLVIVSSSGIVARRRTNLGRKSHLLFAESIFRQHND